MNYKHIKVDSLLKKITFKDSLFGGNYTIDPYQNCEFECLYCDSSFDKTIYIKHNAKEIFEKELKNLKKGRIIVGSVDDPYQKIENKYLLTRELLKQIKKNGFSCHILTKSDLILRDIDIISEIKDSKITISVISLNKSIYDMFEKNVSPPKIRLKLIEKLSNSGITTGCGIIPVLPFFVDNEIENIIKTAKKHKAEYILHKYLELKGELKNYFIDIIKEKNFPLLKKYNDLYKHNYLPNKEYINILEKTVNSICNKYKIKNKI